MYKSFHVHIKPLILHCWTAFCILFLYNFFYLKVTFKPMRVSKTKKNKPIHVTKLNLRGDTFQPQAKLSYYSYYSCNDWISPAKFGWAIVNVTAPSMVADQACFHLSSVSLAMELFPSSFMREPQAWGLGECNWVGLGKYVWAKICWTGNMCNMLHLHSYIQSSL